MKNSKQFYLKPHFYLTAVCVVLTLTSLLLYAIKCPSEFNGGVVSSGVVLADVLALVWCAVALAGTIVPQYVKNPVVAKICSYARFFKYLAFFALLGGFFTQILDEYSLLGTILYPIVSGTKGDPVDSVLATCYFTSLIISFVAAICAAVSGGMERRAAAKEEKNAEAIA